ncbi:MAG TPA: PepSY domain-containing protein [Luteimonas sp.]|nr:PepSY domain-containing protein [Luteimonas sp.]
MNAPSDLRRRAWRWHFIAAVLVIPFVLWQSLTGTLYLWSEHWVDARHAELRFVEPGARRVALDAQVDAARAFHAGRGVAAIRVPADPARSTQVMFNDAPGLPLAAFVDPYRGVLLGSLEGSGWPVGWSRSLHGGWPLGDAGSWLLEIGASWTIVMVLTGLVLWWPRDGRGLRAVLPRVRSGRHVLWRDLHACAAVWCSLLIVLFLFSALPWTSFWGGWILQPARQALGQQGPAAAGFAPVFAGSGTAHGPRLQTMLDTARAQGLDGDLLITMVDGPPGSAVSIRQLKPRASQERALLLDRGSAGVLANVGWEAFPPLAKAVATGVDIHEAAYFGRVGPWINTLFALALAWLCITGLVSWWTRKPAASTGIPPGVRAPWPWWLRMASLALFALLPLLALSAALLWLLERMAARLQRPDAAPVDRPAPSHPDASGTGFAPEGDSR